MVSRADPELINNFINELEPHLAAVEAGVQEFAAPDRNSFVVGQAIQALTTIRGAGLMLMQDGLATVAGWLIESFERVQNNPDIEPDEAHRRLSGLFSALNDCLKALNEGDQTDAIALRAKTIFEAIPEFSGPLPGTGRLSPQSNLDQLFGNDYRSAQTDRISMDELADTKHLAPIEPGEAIRSSSVPDPAPTDGWSDWLHDDDRPREIFRDEAADVVAAYGDCLRDLARDPADEHAIRRLSEASGTLNGAADMTGFPLIAQISGAIQNLLDAHVEYGLPVSRDVLELIAVSWKMLRTMIARLDDLSGFASPGNSVVNRANMLRNELVPETARSGVQSASEPAEPPEASPTTICPDDVEDRVIAVDVRKPEPQNLHGIGEDHQIDIAEPSSAPQPPASPSTEDVAEGQEGARPYPSATELAEEIAGAPADVGEAGARIEADEESDTDGDGAGETAPFWAGIDGSGATGAPTIEEPDEPEPFWSPGTDELMRKAVHTDRLIADLYDIPEFADLDENPAGEGQDDFFVPVMDTGIYSTAGSEPDDASWIDAPEGPGSDLLTFDEAPLTEPFWQADDDSTPDSADAARDGQPEPTGEFFEPVSGGTDFLVAAGLDRVIEDPTPGESIDASIFEEVWFEPGGDVGPEGENAILAAGQAISPAFNSELAAVLANAASLPIERPQPAIDQIALSEVDEGAGTATVLLIDDHVSTNPAATDAPGDDGVKARHTASPTLNDPSLPAPLTGPCPALLGMVLEEPGSSSGTSSASLMDAIGEIIAGRTNLKMKIAQLQASFEADDQAAAGGVASLQSDLDDLYARQRSLAADVLGATTSGGHAPLSALEPSLRKVAQQAAERSGRNIRLFIEGGDTLIDIAHIEALTGSLFTLVQRTSEAGIEPAEDRRRLGKPEQGTIRIRAFRDAGETAVEVIDDGAGIEQVVRESLALAGRAIHDCGGRMTVECILGQGATASLRFPARLAAIPAFIARAGNLEFAIPVADVDFVAERIDYPLTGAGESASVEIAGRTIPVVDVGLKLGRSNSPADEHNRGWIILANIHGERRAMLVDELLGPQDIDIEPLDGPGESNPGLAGEAALDGGNMAPVLDVRGLLQAAG